MACNDRGSATTPGGQTRAKTCARALQRGAGYADSAEVANPFEEEVERPHSRCVARQAVPGQARLMVAKSWWDEVNANAVHLSLRDP